MFNRNCLDEQAIRKYDEKLRRALFAAGGEQLKALFPSVLKIKIETKTSPEESWLGRPIIRDIELTSSSNTRFKLNCQWDDCFNGGFDMSDEIVEAIKAKQTKGISEITCYGKLDATAQSPCLLALRFKYRIEYR